MTKKSVSSVHGFFSVCLHKQSARTAGILIKSKTHHTTFHILTLLSSPFHHTPRTTLLFSLVVSSRYTAKSVNDEPHAHIRTRTHTHIHTCAYADRHAQTHARTHGHERNKRHRQSFIISQTQDSGATRKMRFNISLIPIASHPKRIGEEICGGGVRAAWCRGLVSSLFTFCVLCLSHPLHPTVV